MSKREVQEPNGSKRGRNPLGAQGRARRLTHRYGRLLGVYFLRGAAGAAGGTAISWMWWYINTT